MIPAGNWHSQGKRKLEENWMEIGFSWPHRGVEMNAEVTSQHALGRPELRGTVSLEEVDHASQSLKVWTKPVLRGPLRDLRTPLRCYFRGQNECYLTLLQQHILRENPWKKLQLIRAFVWWAEKRSAGLIRHKNTNTARRSTPHTDETQNTRYSESVDTHHVTVKGAVSDVFEECA